MPSSINPGQTERRDSALAEVLAIRHQLHELSNVLTGLLITVGLLKSFVPLIGSGERYASDVEESAERAATLVSEVRVGVHRLQAAIGTELTEPGPVTQSTNVCDVRPSLGQKSGED